MKELHDRAVKAAAAFLERKGAEVVDTDWGNDGLAGRIDLVARDEDAMVFVDVTATDRFEGGFSEGNLTREQFELLAAMWLGEHETEGDITVRFDRIDLIVVGDNRALLRHNINALGSGVDL